MPHNASYCALFLLLLYTTLVCPPTKAQHRVKLPLYNSSVQTNGCTIKSYAIVPTTQQSSSRIFKFTIILINDSSSSVSITNPFDFTNYLLLNKDHKQSLFQQESKVSYEPGSGRQLFSAFYVNHVLLNNKAYNFDYKTNKPLLLPAKGRFEATINVHKFMNTGIPNTSFSAIKTSTNSIPTLRKGKYRFSIQVAIIQNIKFNPFRSELVPVIIK